MRTAFVCLVFSAIACVLVYSACEEGWSEFKEDCIFFDFRRQSWNDAERTCREMGGWLATDDSEDKHDFLRSVLNVLRNWNYKEFYIGASDYYFENDFRWIETGRSVGPFTRWDAGQPSVNSTENCLVLRWTQQDDTELVWSMETCDARHNNPYFICEKKNINATVMSPQVIG